MTEYQKEYIANLNRLLEELGKVPLYALLVDNPFDINNPTC